MRISFAILLLALTVPGCERTTSPQRVILPDRYYVAEAALHYMLDKHSNFGVERDYYSAYVIKPNDFTARLLASFSGYKPIVTTNIQISTATGVVLDKASGKPVKLWTVEVKEIRGDTATAFVSWYSGSLGAGGHTIHLKRKDDRWRVMSEQMDSVS